LATTDLQQLIGLKLNAPVPPGPEYHFGGNDYTVRLIIALSDFLKTPEGMRLKDVLAADLRVKKLLSAGLVSTGGGSSSKLEIDHLAMWFAHYSSKSNVSDAISKLESYLDAKDINYDAVSWLLGIEVDKTVNLVESIQILPIDLMPESGDKEYFQKFDIDFYGPRPLKPKAALVLKAKALKITGPNPTKAATDRFMATFGSLSDAALVLNLVPGVSSIATFTTSYLDDSTPPGPFAGRGASIPIYDISGVSRISRITEEQLKEGKYEELFAAYRKLSGDERERWTLIITRLSQAKRRHDVADKVLDLGIAMEMAVISSPSHKEQLSLSFRLRGARLLSKDVVERKKIYSDLRDVYNYRSAVAHNGLIPKADRKKLESNIDRYEDLGSRLCSALLLNNGKTDWDETLLN
jgi:hypothetical protein